MWAALLVLAAELCAAGHTVDHTVPQAVAAAVTSLVVAQHGMLTIMLGATAVRCLLMRQLPLMALLQAVLQPTACRIKHSPAAQ
jgi:hypothetical protein